MSGSWNILNQSKTGETQYVIAAAQTLSTVVDALLTSIIQQTVVTNAAATVMVASLTSGSGTGAMFTLTATSDAGPITGITVATAGSGYEIGDTITFTAAAFGATAFVGATSDLILKLMPDDFVDLNLTVPGQPSPIIPMANATTLAFNTSGYGQGVTISYTVSAGTDVEVVLDVNNDPSIADTLWVETAAINSTGSGTFFVVSKDSHREVRLRLKSFDLLAPAPMVSSIRLMADS